MLVKLLVLLLKIYHWVISPMLGRRCRFEPSCSSYAQQALEKHGVWHGLRLSVYRLSRCHPWGGCGHDPVPETLNKPDGLIK